MQDSRIGALRRRYGTGALNVPTKERRTYRLIQARRKFKRQRGNRCQYCRWRAKSRRDLRFLDVHNPRGGYHTLPDMRCKVACKWCHGRLSQGKKTKRS